MTDVAVFSFRDALPNAKVAKFERPYLEDPFIKSIIARAEFYDFEKAEPFDILRDCMGAEDMGRAIEVCTASYGFGAACPPTENAVYLIRNLKTNSLKIGVAKHPAHRLMELQIGSCGELKIEALFWTMETKAQSLEYNTHWTLRDRCIRGEWFDVDPVSAGLAVIEEAKKGAVKLSSPEMFTRHREMVRWVVKYETKGRLPDPDARVCATVQKEVDKGVGIG